MGVGIISRNRRIRWFIILMFSVVNGLLYGNTVVQAVEPNTELQMLIDQSKPGDTIHIPPGTYQGPVQVNKPLKLIADQDVVVHGQGDAPVLTIQSDQVTITGWHLVDERPRDPKEATLIVNGNDNVIEQVTIRTNGTGIQLREANRNLIDGVQVVGLTAARGESGSIMRGNGIDLWESYNNRITNSLIDNMYDGIYLENSSDNLIRHNEARNSRYGYHLMFTKNNVIEDNVGVHNVTGAMVMGSEGVRLQNNAFAKQSENVNSQGILLFDVKQTIANNNRVEGNRVGLYVEASSQNQILDNVLHHNFIGIQMIDSSSNELTGNEFVSNVIQAQAEASSNNKVEFNYWDDMQGIDLSGSGRSDLAYQINPFYISLTNDVKAFQIFFGSPGMEFLESLFYNPTDSWLKDSSPLMAPPTAQGQWKRTVDYRASWLGLFLLAVSLICIYRWGVAKQ
jgi:nitrous oxidase accessory protein